MRNTLVVGLTIVLLGICLLSGGCAKPDQNAIKEWQELLKLSADKDKPPTETNQDNALLPETNVATPDKVLQVSLYFGDASGNQLVREERNISKVEGIARETLQELIKGPANVESTQVFPVGSRLLDINLKPDGLCIVDLSIEATQAANHAQEKLMIEAVAKTLGQFPTVQEITFKVNGENVDTLGGYVDLSTPVSVDYSS